MRIAYVTSAVLPSVAANGIQSMQMCAAMARARHDVTLIHQRRDRARSDAGDPFVFYGVERTFARVEVPWPAAVPGQGYLYAVRCVRATSEARPDLVYTRSLRVAAASLMTGHDTTLELHGLARSSRADNRALLRRVARSRRLQRIVVISDALRRDVTERLTGCTVEVVVAHDAAVAAQVGTDPPLLPQPGATLHVGYVGSLLPGKGFEAITALAPRLPTVAFHVVGDTRPIATRSDTLPSNVHLHGFLTPPDAERYRLACDVLIAPYAGRVETYGRGGDVARWMSPLKLFEYMAAGKAIISSDLPVLREILMDGRTAILCPPDDVDAWVAAVASLAEDPGRREQLGAAALDEFQRRHTYDARVAAVLAR